MPTIQTRKRKNGKNTYRVQIRRIDAPPITRSFNLKHDAISWAVETENQISEGTFAVRHEAQKHTVAEMIERYVRTELLNRPRAGYDRGPHLGWWKAQIGSRKLSEVSTAVLVEMRDKLAGETTVRHRLRSPATVNRYLATLSHVFSVAVREWEWMEASPMTRVRKLKEPRGRVRFLNDAERATLLAACKNSVDRYIYLIVVLALSTGMRRGEIMNLTWGDVDLERSKIVLQHTKNGERRSVPLVGKAMGMMLAFAEAKRDDTKLLFASEHKDAAHLPKDIRKAWKAVVSEAGLEDFRFHDLRHSAASYLAMNGATLGEIAEVLGHKTLAMVKRYAHFSETHSKAVVQRMNDAIF